MSIRVLLVDDVVEVRRLVRTALRFRGGFQVVAEASDGAEAVRCVGDLSPDVVVLDLGLPDLAGREVLSRIRDASPATKVVIFSGHDLSGHEWLEGQVAGYVLKDTQLDYLVDLLESVGRRTSEEAVLQLPRRADQRPARPPLRVRAAGGVGAGGDPRRRAPRDERARRERDHPRGLHLPAPGVPDPHHAADRRDRHRRGHSRAAAAQRDRGARPRAAPRRRGDHGVGAGAGPGRRQGRLGRAGPPRLTPWPAAPVRQRCQRLLLRAAHVHPRRVVDEVVHALLVVVQVGHQAQQGGPHGLEVGGVDDHGAEDAEPREEPVAFPVQVAGTGGEPRVVGCGPLGGEGLADLGQPLTDDVPPGLLERGGLARASSRPSTASASCCTSHLLDVGGAGWGSSVAPLPPVGKGRCRWSGPVRPARPGPPPGCAVDDLVRFNRGVTTDYRFSHALLVRSVGALLVLLGVVVVVVAVLVAALDLPGAVLSVGVVVAVALVVAGALAASRLTRVLTLDETGYRVRLLRGAGVRAARWREVEDAVTMTVAGHDCVVLRLKDGRTTSIPVDVLEAEPEGLLAELSRHLDRGHGYRRLG